MMSRHAFSRRRYLAPWIAFVLSLLTYWLTVEPTASWWDCPEYLTTALLLEIGHPPGNPVWMLTHRALSLAGTSVEAQVLIVNLASGLFMAMATGLLCSVAITVMRSFISGRGWVQWGALAGSMCFAWADSPWFSAVEAEVYAMSMFLTALSIWLMLKWRYALSSARRTRILILIGYITGLSIGVHQLNLLSIPALALIFVFRRPGKIRRRALTGVFLSFLIIACILLGMMPSMILNAGYADLFAVNSLHCPLNSGACLYLILTLTLAWCYPFVAALRGKMLMKTLWTVCLLYITGLTTFGGRHEIGIILAAVAGLCLIEWARHHAKGFLTFAWMFPVLLTGYSAYGLILLRGAANPPMNQGDASNPFRLYSYLMREQYGSQPLFYGRTPFSRPVKKDGDYVRIPDNGYRHEVAYPSGVLMPRSGMLDSLTLSESLSLCRRAAGGDKGRRYLTVDHRYHLLSDPELDMWFPRIVSSDPSHLEAYASWADADTTKMDRVMRADGSLARRPTYLQHLRMMLGYQFGYMYGRYLLWNYSGRQNDISSTGEADHGNFITGIQAVDDLMLGADSLLPPEASSQNHGRNRYWTLPLLTGILGLAIACRRNRQSRLWNWVIAALFLMNGIAIVFYLNQNPGEPRERDYSFLGSYWAYAVWICFGLGWMLSRSVRPVAKVVAGAFATLLPLWMLAENFDDHDRSGRWAVEDFAANTLESLAPDAILMVSGDNATFPLWFAQHVKGVRRDVTIVNTSYLVCPWYVDQLRIPTWEAEGIKFTMPPHMAAYGAFTHTLVSSGDTAVLDAVEALRALYAFNQGRETASTPRLGSSRLAIGQGAHRWVADISREARGSSGGWLGLDELAVIDMVATNAASSAPRPLYWHSSVGWKQYAGLRNATRRAFSGRRWAPEDSVAYLADDVPGIAGRLRWGGLESRDDYYVDEVTGREIVSRRLELLYLAQALLKAGSRDEAREIVSVSLSALPASRWPYERRHNQDTIVDEAREWAFLLKQLGDSTTASEILAADSLRHKAWRRYYRGMPPSRRHAVSPASRALAVP